MSVPVDVRKAVSELLWEQADELDWVCLNNFQKSEQYKIWAQDDRIGVVLSRYMPLERVHPYIKDSLLKPYAKSKKPEVVDILRLLQCHDSVVVEDYIKPHGFRLDDGRIICWGRAVDWKIVLLALFERSKELSLFKPYAAVLSESNGRFSSVSYQSMIREASELLGIKILFFLE